LHGLGLAAHRLWTAKVGGAGALFGRFPRLAATLSMLFTFAFVVLCFTIFRCPNIETTYRFFTGSQVLSRVTPVSYDLWLLVALLGTLQLFALKRRAWLREKVHAVPDVAFYPALGAVAAAFVHFTPLSSEAFIYFQF
jgi:hypothetical protein